MLDIFKRFMYKTNYMHETSFKLTCSSEKQ